MHNFSLEGLSETTYSLLYELAVQNIDFIISCFQIYRKALRELGKQSYLKHYISHMTI